MDINATIEQVERLYHAVTGHEMPATSPGSPIPPEQDPRRYLDEQLERLGRVLEGMGPQGMHAQAWEPALTAWEAPEHYVMTLAVPGVPRERVRVTRVRDTLVVEGERGQPEDLGLEAGQRTFSEDKDGPFRRVIAMPTTANLDDIQVTCRHGLLAIKVAKVVSSTEDEKQIPVS